MKKWIVILGFSLILTGCFSSIRLESQVQDVGFDISEVKEHNKEKSMKIDDDIKDVIQDINNLRDKYKDYINENGYDSIYINIYEEEYRGLTNVEISSRDISIDAYFNDLVEILDKTIAEGLQDYILEMKNKNIVEEVIIKKIGRTVVSVGDEGVKSNDISIKINFLDIEDEYYRDIFNKISDDKYVLDNVILGEKLDLVDFVNVNQTHNYYYNLKGARIRYNMFLKDKDIEKVNILIQRQDESKFLDEDIDVFNNLLNNLDVDKEEKDLLANEYKNLLETSVKNKKIDLDNYNVYIRDKKVSFYSGNNENLMHISIERK